MAGRPQRRKRLIDKGLLPPEEPHVSKPRHKFTDEDRANAILAAREKKLLQKAGAIRREEEIQEALKRNAHRHVAVQDRLLKALEALAEKAELGVLDKGDIPLLKTLLAEDRANLDRVFGKTTQRQQIDQHSTSTHVDVAELMRAARSGSRGVERGGGELVLEPSDVFEEGV